MNKQTFQTIRKVHDAEKLEARLKDPSKQAIAQSVYGDATPANPKEAK